MKQFFITTLFFLAAHIVRAQCPGCVPVDCSAQNPDGGLCDTIITGMANHPLDKQISFFMPKEVYTTLLPGGGYVQLDRIQVTGIVGLPLGLSWETSKSPSNEYFPQQGGDSIGCARLCGTPLQSGTFPLVVYLLADVTAPVVGQVKNQSQTYTNATVIIIPDTSGGVASFSITPNITSSCDPLTLTFEGKIDGAPNPTTYDWDFGNGSTSAAKNPGSQTYSDAGIYPVSLTTSIYNYVITEVRVFNVNNTYSGDIEELTNLQNPDLYFNIPVLGYTSSSGTDSKTATWSGLSIEIPAGTTEFELRVWDDDNGPPFGSQDDSLGRAIINVARGTFLWNDVNGTVTNGVIVMDTMLGNVFSETLDITIAPYSTADLFTMPSDSVCEGDTVLLTLEGTDVFQFNWFKDSIYFAAATDTFLELESPAESGIYWVEVLNSVGCKTVSAQKSVLVDPVPPVPVFYLNPPNNLLYTINAGGIAVIQWFLDGNPIAGATRGQYTATDTGFYTVEYTNYVGCSAISAPVDVSMITSVGEFAEAISATVFPNPSNGNFTVQLQVQQPGDVEIVLTDNIGKEIFHATETAATLVYTKDFDFSALSAGVYFLKVMSANKQLTKKILLTN